MNKIPIMILNEKPCMVTSVDSLATVEEALADDLDQAAVNTLLRMGPYLYIIRTRDITKIRNPHFVGITTSRGVEEKN